MSRVLGLKEPLSSAAPAGLPEDAVAVRGLNKTYRSKSGTSKPALTDSDLSIPRGSLFGLQITDRRTPSNAMLPNNNG